MCVQPVCGGVTALKLAPHPGVWPNKDGNLMKLLRFVLYLTLLAIAPLTCFGLSTADAAVTSKTPTAAPQTPTATPTSAVESITFAQRPAWRAILDWPDDCEELYNRFPHQPEDDGGVTIYMGADEHLLVLVTCNLGPYWVEQRAYWLHRVSLVARPLTVPELVDADAPARGLHAVEVLHGAYPDYDPETQTLTNLHAARGLKDCGVYYSYHLAEGRFVLDTVRARACDDSAGPIVYSAWPLIYPTAATATPTPVATAVAEDGFRRVAPLPADLPGAITGLEALPDGDLRLVTTAGFALFHAGAWESYFLDPVQHFIGVDGAGRMWHIPAAAPETIDYFDSAAAEEAAFVRADAGWLPPAAPETLVGRGLFTDDQGQLWLATDEDVRLFADGRWTIFTRTSLTMPRAADADLAPAFVLTGVADRQQMWVGVCDWATGPSGGGGARWLDTAALAAGVVAWRGAQTPVGGGCVTAIAGHDDGRVWIGLDHGAVEQYDQRTQKWRAYPLPTPEEDRAGYALMLAVDRAGAPWVASALCGAASCDVARTLHHLQEGVWRAVSGPEAGAFAAAAGAPDILFDGAGTPWLLNDGALFRIADDRATPATAATVQAAAVDAAGQLWLVATAGDDDPALWVLAHDARLSTYRNAAGGFSFPWPAEWYFEEEGTEVRFSESVLALRNAPERAPLMVMRSMPLPAWAETLDMAPSDDPVDYVTAMIADLKMEGDDITRGEFHGYPAAYANLTGENPARQGMVLMILAEGRGVGSGALAPAADWRDFHALYLTMLRGLTLTAPEYVSDADGYRLNYPGAWLVAEKNGVVSFGPSEAALSGVEQKALREGFFVIVDAIDAAETIDVLELAPDATPADFVTALAVQIDAELGAVETGAIDGRPAAYGNMTGELAGMPYTGALAIIQVDDRLVGAYALAAPEQWGEGRPLFSDMLDSMTFFAP